MLLGELRAHRVGDAPPTDDVRQELNPLEQRRLQREGRDDREKDGDDEVQAERDREQDLAGSARSWTR